MCCFRQCFKSRHITWSSSVLHVTLDSFCVLYNLLEQLCEQGDEDFCDEDFCVEEDKGAKYYSTVTYARNSVLCGNIL